MTTVEGPDFICIGMAKAGTGWLFDQLKVHPDFWLPPVKELSYLSRSKPRLKAARKTHERARDRPDWEDRDFQFLEEAVALAREPRDIARYAALYRHKGNQKSGDITPGYGLISEDVIGEIAERLPHVKVIYLVREPIARLWSHINLFYNRDKFDAALLENTSRFADYLDNHKTLMSSFSGDAYSRALEKGRTVAPVPVFLLRRYRALTRENQARNHRFHRRRSTQAERRSATRL